MSSTRRPFNGKPSFNKIQSWLEEVQSVERTQRMLLNGGSRMFEGSKLKNKGGKSKRQPSAKNLIQINSESKVFKISSNDDQQKNMSKTFTPFIKYENNKDNFYKNTKELKICSQNITHRQKNVNNEIIKFTQGNFRETIKLNTKQLQFKLKKIKRVQSASLLPKSPIKGQPISGHLTTKQKISKILSWKGETVMVLKNEYFDKQLKNQQQKRKMRTVPSSPKVRSNTNEEQNLIIQHEHMSTSNTNIKQIKNEQIDTEGSNEIKFIKTNLSTQNFIKQKQISKKKQAKLDPRVRLQLHIAHKLFHMKELKTKPFLIHKKLKQAEQKALNQ